MSIAPTVSTIQRFLINTKLTILLLISLLRMLSTMLMLVTTVMKRMIKMTEHCRACKKEPSGETKLYKNAKMMQILKLGMKVKKKSSEIANVYLNIAHGSEDIIGCGKYLGDIKDVSSSIAFSLRHTCSS